MSHTILLVQPNTRPDTRTYSDYESLNECLEGICKIYEEHLKRKNPECPSITYDISQLFDFIDQLNDLSCLVYQKISSTYLPHNKDWLKEKIYIMLRKQSHTILLVQPNTRPDTRTYSDYESLNECLEGICKIYEEHLKRQNPECPSITYDISQLFDFIDQLNDLSCLVFQKNLGNYVPHNKDWLKEKIYIMLRKQAGR